jgi:NAD(P)-dependent dehydrogenase (short-subunit alcohol dehydrogenase family)
MSKTWFITGASSGFGRELAELLLQRGDRVAATVRKPDALQNLVAKYGDRLWVAILDVTDSATVRNVVDRAFSELQRIDVVVSNAGYALFGAAEEVGDAQIERQLATNLLGSILRLCSTSRNAPPTETQPAPPADTLGATNACCPTPGRFLVHAQRRARDWASRRGAPQPSVLDECSRPRPIYSSR